jgi:hypothetical protein
VISDPCFTNSVIGLASKTFPLSKEVTFETTSTDSVSTSLNRPQWCGSIVADSISCTLLPGGT